MLFKKRMSFWAFTCMGMCLFFLFPELVLCRSGYGIGNDPCALLKTDRRIALVIGNRAYRNSFSPLKNTVSDARLMASTLTELGFEVDLKEDLTLGEFRESIYNFGRRLAKADVGLFYYAGHAAQLKGINYLIPVEARIRTENQVSSRALGFYEVLSEMESSPNHMNIIILDACRGNFTFTSYRSTNQGLAFTQAPSGTIIAYSTHPGQIASDGKGQNSDYTYFLAKNLKKPGLRLVDIFRNVRNSVKKTSGGQQVPIESTSLECPFYFTSQPKRYVLKNAQPANVILKKPKEIDNSGKGKKSTGVAVSKHNKRVKPAFPKKSETIKSKKSSLKIKFTSVNGRDIFTEPMTGMKFVRVLGGCYVMGCGSWVGKCEPDEYPPHEVCVGDFWMSRYETTNEDFVKFLNDSGLSGSVGETLFNTKREQKDSYIEYKNGKYRVEAGYEKRPVVWVTWYGAMRYARWMSEKTGLLFMLPTEAQWEYACRSRGKKEVYSGADDYLRVAWTRKDIGNAKPVGMKMPNDLGIYDLSGNVFEWCRDVYHEQAYTLHTVNNPNQENAPADFKEEIKVGHRRVIRGGAWRYLPFRSRCGNRGSHALYKGSNSLGFRLVMDPSAIAEKGNVGVRKNNG